MKNYVLLILILFFLTGCLATYSTFNEPKIYSATRMGIDAVKTKVSKEWGTDGHFGALMLGIVIFIDLPFSLVFDTILLPYKTYLIIAEDKNATKPRMSK